MSTTRWSAIAVLLIFGAAMAQIDCTGPQQTTQPTSQESMLKDSMARLEQELTGKYGAEVAPRLKRGLQQAAGFWRPEDGTPADFETFVRAAFAGNQATLDQLFERMEFALESVDGHMLEISRDFRWRSDLDLGTIYPFDEILAGYDPSAHIDDDFFGNKLAFTVLLNFPLTTLPERLEQGEKWSRRQWAEARLAQRYSKRIPAEVNLSLAQAAADAERYIAEYNIWMYHLLDENGSRLFPPKLRLLSHWNLRDELKADYADAAAGQAKQKMIQRVMERIIDQSIPRVVINNPAADWNPYTNEVKPAAVSDSDVPPLKAEEATAEPESDVRYATLLETFQASRKVDPYSPTAPTMIARRFDENREIPEARVQAMLEQVLSSPLVPRVAQLIEKRLGRPLEPYDIWYNGFRSQSAYSESQLDEMVSKKYPTADAYKADIPNLLVKLGFARERAEYIASSIAVDPARGSGHAMGAALRGDKAHLRTRIEKGGMNYKGFNVAVHEMGHNVEQVLSLNDIDHTLLQGVPNTAFTEAFAFVFQSRDLELLGLVRPDARARALQALDTFWGTFEIGGVALVDMKTWHWMYDHPEATPAQLRDAVLEIAKQVWNQYYAPVFKKSGATLLGVYSHMIDSFLYLPDYPIGYMIAIQIEQQMEKAGKIGPEFERMAKQGNIAPDLWMRGATGRPVGAEALLEAAEKALTELQ